jgi:hypothetical protein
MKKIVVLIAVVCTLGSLSGCIVVPARGGYYRPAPAYHYYPAPHYYYGY